LELRVREREVKPEKKPLDSSLDGEGPPPFCSSDEEDEPGNWALDRDRLWSRLPLGEERGYTGAEGVRFNEVAL
jgi:hypothetical protein